MVSTEWARWHAEHERRLADPHGFLAVTSLNFLTAEPQRFPDAPSTWSTGPDGPVVELADGETLTVHGAKVTGRHAFGVIAERGGIDAVAGDAVVEVARRGGFDIVRPRHPNHPLRTRYRGTPAYEPDDKWVLTGRFVPFDAPRDVTVGAAVEGLEHVYESPGRVEFEALGTPLTLTVFNGHAPGSFFALFTTRPPARPPTPPAAAWPSSRPPSTGPWYSTSPEPPTCPAPTPISRPARCRRPTTGCRSRSRPASRLRTKEPDQHCIPVGEGRRSPSRRFVVRAAEVVRPRCAAWARTTPSRRRRAVGRASTRVRWSDPACSGSHIQREASRVGVAGCQPSVRTEPGAYHCD